LNALEQVFERMAENPDSFGLAPEGELLVEDIRQCLFKTPKGRSYRVLYLIESDKVVVLRVRGPGQPPLSADELRN